MKHAAVMILSSLLIGAAHAAPPQSLPFSPTPTDRSQAATFPTPGALPNLHDVTTTTDDTYRYRVVEATCSDMAGFLAAVPKPGDAARQGFITWLSQQPGNFVFVDRLSDGKDTSERGCFVRTDSGYRITIHNRDKIVQSDRPR